MQFQKRLIRPVTAAALLIAIASVSLVDCLEYPCPAGTDFFVYGLRVESGNVISYDPADFATLVTPGKTAVRFFGCSITQIERVRLVPQDAGGRDIDDEAGSPCMNEKAITVDQFDSIQLDNALFHTNLASVGAVYSLCVSPVAAGLAGSRSNGSSWVFISLERHMRIKVQNKKHTYYLPLPVQICIVAVLLVLTGLFSGLTLGLMSLDITELRVIQKSGTEREKVYAERIIPIRKAGNYLLCCLTFSNTVVNSAISILMDDMTSGIIALVVSTIAIVLLGEILPQSVCSRYGLAVGARTIWITRFVMVLTFPVAYPVSKFLDLILGKDVGNIYDKAHLLELIRVSGENVMEQGTVQIMKIAQGAFELAQKTVSDVMTHIQDVYMMNIDTVLDTKTLSDIVNSGYTRIPVYEKNSDNVCAVLNVKDLVLLDPDDKIPLKTICYFYQHQVRFVLADTPLSAMLDEFRTGKYHMALVRKIVDTGLGDPYYELVGLITLEDVIEEIIQAEIMDETDVLTDNRQRIRRKETLTRDLSIFISGEEPSHLSPQLAMATFQYLTTQLLAFRDGFISEQVLQRLIKQNTFREKPLSTGLPRLLFEKGKLADYFLLVLEGRLEVIMGEEEFIFEAGPFFPLGKQVLEQMMGLLPKMITLSTVEDNRLCFAFLPDFTARVTQEVTCIRVKASDYLKAYRATLIEREKSGSSLSIIADALSGGTTAASATNVATTTTTANGNILRIASDSQVDGRKKYSGMQRPISPLAAAAMMLLNEQSSSDTQSLPLSRTNSTRKSTTAGSANESSQSLAPMATITFHDHKILPAHNKLRTPINTIRKRTTSDPPPPKPDVLTHSNSKPETLANNLQTNQTADKLDDKY